LGQKNVEIKIYNFRDIYELMFSSFTHCVYIRVESVGHDQRANK
jgi:hypothetical protein